MACDDQPTSAQLNEEEAAALMDAVDASTAAGSVPAAAGAPTGAAPAAAPATVGAAATVGSTPAAATSAKPATSTAHKVWTVVGIVLCIILVPILALNITLIVKSYLDPDHVPGVGGTMPLIVLSDSMYPDIQKGDLIFCRDVDPTTLKEGDVIAFFDPESTGSVSVVTHRIIDVSDQNGTLEFTTQGDNNSSPDAHTTVPEDVIGLYDSRLPGVGNIAMFMQSTPGLIVCVVVPIVLLVIYDVVRTRLYQRRSKEDADELIAELKALREAQAAQAAAAAVAQAQAQQAAGVAAAAPVASSSVPVAQPVQATPQAQQAQQAQPTQQAQPAAGFPQPLGESEEGSF